MADEISYEKLDTIVSTQCSNKCMAIQYPINPTLKSGLGLKSVSAEAIKYKIRLPEKWRF